MWMFESFDIILRAVLRHPVNQSALCYFQVIYYYVWSAAILQLQAYRDRVKSCLFLNKVTGCLRGWRGHLDMKAMMHAWPDGSHHRRFKTDKLLETWEHKFISVSVSWFQAKNIDKWWQVHFRILGHLRRLIDSSMSWSCHPWKSICSLPDGRPDLESAIIVCIILYDQARYL